MTNAVHVSSQGKQDYATPWWLVRKIEKRFGVEFILDMAASMANRKAPHAICEGSLEKNWLEELSKVDGGMKKYVCWLNPPFDNAKAFMQKSAIASLDGWRGVTLTLSSLGTAWYRDHVQPYASSFILRKRVTFDGQAAPYPKELMISLWGLGFHGLSWWDFTEGMD